MDALSIKTFRALTWRYASIPDSGAVVRRFVTGYGEPIWSSEASFTAPGEYPAGRPCPAGGGPEGSVGPVMLGGLGVRSMSGKLLRCGYGTDPGGHGVVDGPDADRVGLVPAGGGHAGKAAAVLCPPVPAGGSGRDLLRAARGADRRGLGGADPGRVHLQRQGVQPVHPAPHPGCRAACRPAPGGGEDGQRPGLPQRR